MLSDIEGEGRGGEEYRRDMGMAFTVLEGPRLVRHLGLNLMNPLLGEGVITVNLLFHYW
jgi:hypothetical protein